ALRVVRGDGSPGCVGLVMPLALGFPCGLELRLQRRRWNVFGSRHHARVTLRVGGQRVAIPGATEVLRIKCCVGGRWRLGARTGCKCQQRQRRGRMHERALHGAAGSGLPSSMLMLGGPAGPPLPNTRPSASFTCLSRAPGSPVCSGATTTVSWSFGLIMLNFQPVRLRMPGLAHSMVQCRILPFASGASMWMYTCGFCQRNSVTCPVRRICLSLSNMAKEWCALALIAPAAITNNASSLRNVTRTPCNQFLVIAK